MFSKKTISIVKSTAPILAAKGVEITSCFYKNLFTDHPELLNIFNHANQKQGRQQTALANTVYAAAKYIDQLEVLLPSVKQIAHKHRSLVVKPEHYPIVGEYLLLAIKEVLGEAATDEIIEAWGEAYGVIAQVFIDVEQEMYTEAARQQEGWAEFKDFTVVKKEVESSLITSFYLKPADGAKVPDFLAGQYITLRLAVPEEQYLMNRQYSLSDASNGEYFRISVKREAENHPHGKVSNYLHDRVDVGETIEITAPAGDFTLPAEGNEPIYLISGGVGVTPMLSMLKTISKKQPNRATTFIQAVKNGTVHAFYDEVNTAIETMPKGKSLFVYETPSEEDRVKMAYDYEGFVTQELLASLNIEEDATFYVCGPVPFMKAVLSYLTAIGVPSEKIHYEFFGPAMDIKEEVTVN